MNFNLKLIISKLSKKFLVQIYFFFFIILNIFDFLNYLSSDLDFFKKLLSWFIIGYIFYSISPTKIFIGKRLKKYDLFYIIAFSMISIVNSLVLYTRTSISGGNYDSNSFYFFNYILTPISNIISSSLLNNFFILGILLIILISIILLKNHNVKEESFLGSFNFSIYLLFMKFNYLVLIFFAIFFAIIIFHFFMEWFALAVDSVILVLGLIYYIFKYFHDHVKNKFSNSLKEISNTGNEFYSKLILTFSNKKTIFIGISLLLTLHLIVDIGVYMVPYSIGTSNTLYFNGLNAIGSEHIPLFNFIDPQNSRIYEDFLRADSNYFILFSIIIIYFMDLFLICSLMFLPFYILYNNILKKKINFSKLFSIFFLISLFFILFLFLLNISKPINIDFPLNSNIKGVDIHTNTIINSFDIMSYNNMIYSLLISIILFLTISLFIIFKYLKYEFYFQKIIYFIILLFFIYYISIFFFSTIEKEYTDLFQTSNLGFNNISKIYLNNSLYKSDIKITENFQFRSFSDSTGKDFILNQLHNDYLFIELKNSNMLEFKDNSKVYINSKNNSQIIYFLGENHFKIKKIKRGYKLIENIDLTKIIKMNGSKISFKELLIKFIEYLRLFFLSLFYIFGTLAFIFHYSKTNLLNK